MEQVRAGEWLAVDNRARKAMKGAVKGSTNQIRILDTTNLREMRFKLRDNTRKVVVNRAWLDVVKHKHHIEGQSVRSLASQGKHGFGKMSDKN